MAYFARKLWYGACDGDDSHVFAAFLELRRRKNGKPIAFVLFEHRVFTSECSGRASGTSENRMIRFPHCASAEEALKHLVPGQEGFPGWNCEQWERTTLWAYEAGVGGSYQLHHPGRWVRIGVPPLWSKRRRRKKPLQFGLPAHIILVDQARIRGLEDDIDELADQLNDLESYDDEDGSNYVPEENQAEYELIETRVATLRCGIHSIEAKIEALRGRMRSQVREMFPEPLGLIPKRVSRLKEEQRTR
jgi:hypothetical protein